MIRAPRFSLRTTTALATLGACLLVGDAAYAVQAHPGLAHGLETPTGMALRSQRRVVHSPPASAARAWSAFLADHPGAWVGSWDRATGVVHRLWGPGIAAPGTSASATTAEKVARTFLAAHLDLVAPGVAMADLRLVSNVVHRGVRTVAFTQSAHGMPVVGGQLSFRFSHDRLVLVASEAVPHATVEAPVAPIALDEAQAIAERWIAEDFGATVRTLDRDALVVLPLVGDTAVTELAVVHAVVVDGEHPRGQWKVYVDAVTGDVVAREQTLRFASSNIFYDVPERRPGSARLDYPARHLDVAVGAGDATTDSAGQVTFNGASADVTLGVEGPFVRVNNQGGPEVTETINLLDGGTFTWSRSSTEVEDAQLTTFIHGQVAKDYAVTFAPELGWLQQQLRANVNLDDECNAFFDGQAGTINFFRSSSNCQNTGRLADVVHHEFGHALHLQAVFTGAGEFESALSEGASDYVAATITNDSGMGRGFFYTNAPLRELNPVAGEAFWPDDIQPDPHGTGLIIGGALWDMRQNLIDELGQTEGVTISDQLFYGALRNASDIPSMYAELLVMDDDDGDLSNGTPHVCAISEAFGRHGLRDISVAPAALSVEPPSLESHRVDLRITGLFAQCPSDTFDDVNVQWRREDAPSGVLNTVAMEGGPTDYTAQIPTQPDGTVVQYRVGGILSSTSVGFPDNAADPWYQFFVGEVTELYCTDFETNPFEEGWTSGLLAGEDQEGANDWQWGSPKAPAAANDPLDAFSGNNIIGNDLGGGNFNGLYQGGKTNFAASPVVDVSGHDAVRLQYRRWLNVEDGFWDRATIYANEQVAWSNLASLQEATATVHHQDREWRFHDVDLTPHVENGQVQVRFEIASDQGLQFGGWSIDDVCIVAYDAPNGPAPACGDGVVGPGESCDDGNTVGGDGCSNTCQTETEEPEPEGDGPTAAANAPFTAVDSGCGCHVVGEVPANAPAPWWLLVGVAGVWATRRRRE